MRHDETENLPPTQRRGRNGWDALAEMTRVLGRGVGGFGRLIVSPGGLVLIIVVLVALDRLNPGKLEAMMNALAGLVDKIR